MVYYHPPPELARYTGYPLGLGPRGCEILPLHALLLSPGHLHQTCWVGERWTGHYGSLNSHTRIEKFSQVQWRLALGLYLQCGDDSRVPTRMTFNYLLNYCRLDWLRCWYFRLLHLMAGWLFNLDMRKMFTRMGNLSLVSSFLPFFTTTVSKTQAGVDTVFSTDTTLHNNQRYK